MKNVNTFSHLECNLFNVSLLYGSAEISNLYTMELDALENLFVYQAFQPPYINFHDLKFMTPKLL